MMKRQFESIAFAGLFFFGCAESVLAEPENGDKKHIAVFVSKENSEDAKIEVKVNGKSHTFNLPAMKDGENQALKTDDGTVVAVSRKGNEVTAKIGDETIQLPVMQSADHELEARVHGHTDKEKVKIIKHEVKMEGDFKNSLLISGVQLTEDQQKKVREAIKKAGIDKPVKFIHGEMHVMHMGEGNHGFKWQSNSDGQAKVVVVEQEASNENDKEIVKEIKIIQKSEEKIEKK